MGDDGEIEIIKSRYWGIQDPDMDRVLEAMLSGEDMGTFEFVPSRRSDGGSAGPGPGPAGDGDDWLFPEAEFSSSQSNDENEWDQAGSAATTSGADGQSFIAQAMASMLAALAGRQNDGGENQNSNRGKPSSGAGTAADSDDDSNSHAVGSGGGGMDGAAGVGGVGGGGEVDAGLREVERQFFEAVSRASSGAPASRSMDHSTKPFSSFLPTQPAVIRMGDGLKDLDLDRLLASVTEGSGPGAAQPSWRPDRNLVEVDHDLDELVVMDEHGEPAPVRQSKPTLQHQLQRPSPQNTPASSAAPPGASRPSTAPAAGTRGGAPARGGGAASRGGAGRGGGRVSSARGAAATKVSIEPLDSDDSDDDEADLLEQRRRFKAQREAEAEASTSTTK